MSDSRKIILITGATSGIGLALAHRYAQRPNVRLVLVGRRPLKTLKDPLFTADTYCRADLGAADSHETIQSWLTEHGLHQIHTLIHNAAVGWYGPPQNQSPAEIRKMVAVNLGAPVRLTHTLYPLLEKTAGHLVFVSSVASVLPTADYAAYTATKAALDGFARSLRIELAARSSVTVQVLHPGATRTPLHEKIGIPRDEMNWSEFAPAETVAAEMVRAIDGRSRTRSIGGNNKLLRGLGRLFGGVIEWMQRPVRADNLHFTDRPHVVITGAADGIGRAMAERFARDGYRVTGIDHDKKRGEQVSNFIKAEGGDCRFLHADLADADELNHVIDGLGYYPPVDVFINNAGISAAGHFVDMPLDKQMAVIDVNLIAPLVLTAGVLRAGRMSTGGRMVFISSLSKFVSYPGAAVYAATKDGLASFAASINTAESVVTRSLVVYPGPTRTAHARRYSPDNSREASRMPPEAVALQVFSAVERGQRTLLPGIGPKLFAALGFLFPRLSEWLMKRTLFDKLSDSAD